MARYSDEVIEEVRVANDIVEVISNYVTLKRKGNNFFGLCPFHREKTPSFSVSADRQIYHCFGCGEGGNVIRFIMKLENIAFKEALELLAERAKIELPSYDVRDIGMSQDELKIRENKKNQMYNINKEAGRFFYNNIEKSPIAIKYINRRNLNPKTIAKFGIGFSPNDNSLYKYLLNLGFKEEDIIATGLAGKTENGILYDKFKDRLMFPIFDIRDRVIAFGGRSLENDEIMKERHIPKYINSPENLIYSKGKHLYGLNIVKKNNEKMKRILVVEGYMDVISPYQYGITNIVASLGTALTSSQGILLRRYAEEIVFSYDSDVAGQSAIMRGLEIMQSLGITAKVLQMEGAKDPDEYVIKYGPERFEKLIDNSISLVEFKINLLKKDYNLEDTTDKIKFLTKMAEILSKVENNIERDIYVDKLSKEIGVGKEAIIAEIEKFLFKDKSNIKNWQEPKLIIENKKKENNNSLYNIEKMIIYLLSEKNIDVYKLLKENIKPEYIQNEIRKELIKKLYEEYENGDITNIDITNICKTDEEFNEITEVLMTENINEDIIKVTNDIIKNFNYNIMQNKKKSLIEAIQNTEDYNERHNLEKELNEIIIALARR